MFSVFHLLKSAYFNDTQFSKLLTLLSLTIFNDLLPVHVSNSLVIEHLKFENNKKLLFPKS